MQKNTIIIMVLFLIGLVLVFSYIKADPNSYNGKYEPPNPRDIEINGITFSVPGGFMEDRDSYSAIYEDTFSNHSVTKEERTFHQNDILILYIKVYDLKDANFTLNDLNDGSYEIKSINGIEGFFKTEEVETHSGFVKNNHPRYYFNYVKDNRIVMIQCDVMNVLNQLVK
ncbi:hypothetical protein [Methanobrevibacter sp.]|uniref:hypothetical protein n=1 Tax=Methanobrevibacter sp. TaxID=66852 RepID=UPI003890D099